MKFKILSTDQTILADLEFVTAHYPNDFEEVIEPVDTTPPLKPTITRLQYMQRFTDDELEAIYTVAKSSVKVEVWLEKFKLASEINLNDPTIEQGLLALETAGLLAVGRAQEILA